MHVFCVSSRDDAYRLILTPVNYSQVWLCDWCFPFKMIWSPSAAYNHSILKVRSTEYYRVYNTGTRFKTVLRLTASPFSLLVRPPMTIISSVPTCYFDGRIYCSNCGRKGGQRGVWHEGLPTNPSRFYSVSVEANFAHEISIASTGVSLIF